MNFQEIIVFLLVLIAVVYSLRTFLKQFIKNDTSCNHCSCEPLPKKIAENSRNTVRFKKINTF
jgi:hypothetical protein